MRGFKLLNQQCRRVPKLDYRIVIKINIKKPMLLHKEVDKEEEI